MVTILNAEISVLGIVLATVASIIIGMVVFSPSVLGNSWMKELKTKMDMSGAKSTDYALSVLSGFLTAVVMSLFIYYAAVSSAFGELAEEGMLMGEWSKLSTGILVGLMTWLGFAATTLLTVSVWERRSKKLYYINLFHHLVLYVVMGVILAFSMSIFE